MLLVNELFSGIGAQSAALKRLGIDFKVVGIAEIDKYAIKSYEAIHGPVRNYGDISKIEKLDYADFWTYSFPCQDISVAGKQAGITERTRSGLLYQVERLLQVSKDHNELPKYLMLENVKNLVGKKFKTQYEEWIQRLDELGYNSYWKVLNAKDYGIPQNRERVFAISIRKNIDTGYVFPEPFKLKIRLKDILEKEVDEKYYLSDEKVKLFIKQGNVNPSGNGMNGNVCTSDVCSTLTTNKGEGPKVLQIGNIVETGNFENPQRGRIYSSDGCSPALNCCGGGGLEPKILQVGKINSSQDGIIISPNGLAPTHTAGHGNCPKILEPQVLRAERTEYGKAIRKKYESGLINESRHNMTELKPRTDGVSNTLTTVQKDNYVIEQLNFQNCPNYSGCDFALICEHSNHCVKKYETSILIPQATKQGYIECSVPGVADLSFPDSKTRRGRVQENGEICPTLMAGQQNICYIEPSGIYTGVSERFQAGPLEGLSRCLKSEKHDAGIIETKPKLVGGVGEINFGKQYRQGNRIYDSNAIAMCLNAQPVGNTGGYSYLYKTDYRIRKLTPLECWRLMGFSDEDFYKAEKECSNSQLYKQAGNSIVVDVLYYIFKNLFIDKPTVKQINDGEQLLGQMTIDEWLGA